MDRGKKLFAALGTVLALTLVVGGVVQERRTARRMMQVVISERRPQTDPGERDRQCPLRFLAAERGIIRAAGDGGKRGASTNTCPDFEADAAHLKNCLKSLELSPIPPRAKPALAECRSAQAAILATHAEFGAHPRQKVKAAPSLEAKINPLLESTKPAAEKLVKLQSNLMAEKATEANAVIDGSRWIPFSSCVTGVAGRSRRRF
jgi:hypothetical protein